MSQYLEFHPLANFFSVLEGDEAKQLQDDIQVRGLQFPIVLYQGKILDGRNRYNACVVLGIEPKTIQYEGDDPEGFVLSANLHRRHLSREQRRELIARLLERHPDITSRKLAGELGVSHATVEKIRKAAVGQINQQEISRTGVDGKKYQFRHQLIESIVWGNGGSSGVVEPEAPFEGE